MALKDGTAMDLLADLTSFADISIRLTDVLSVEKWSKSKGPVMLILDKDAVKMVTDDFLYHFFNNFFRKLN